MTLVLVLPNGEGGGHDDHRGTAHVQGGGFHRRLDADDGQVRVGLAEEMDGRAGGGVAGHHHRFHPLGQEPVHRSDGQAADLGQGFLPIGGVGRVPEEEEVLLGQQGGAGPQHADPPQAGVKDPDGLLSLFHIRSLLWGAGPQAAKPD